MHQLQDPALDSSAIPAHLHEGLWTPIGKRPMSCSIDAVRDIEIPNEDTKILERMHNIVLDECIAPSILPLNQAFVSGGDIMYNITGLHSEFSSGIALHILRLSLLLDCMKGFNYASHSWTHRVLEHARLPAGLRLSIQRLVETQTAFLLFAGYLYPPCRRQCGYRQGGPLSTLLYIICVAPFLHALSQVNGVRKVFGFCDDWEISFTGLRPLRQICSLIRAFEAGSGQQIHRGKSKFLSNREMSSNEKRCLGTIWRDAALAENEIVLGTPLGRNVRMRDFVRKPLSTLTQRITIYGTIPMSLPMRIVVANVYLLSLFS